MKYPGFTSTGELVLPTPRLSRAILASLFLHLFVFLGLQQFRVSLVASSPKVLRAELRPAVPAPVTLLPAPRHLQPLASAAKRPSVVARQSTAAEISPAPQVRRAAALSELQLPAESNRMPTVQFLPAPPATTQDAAVVPSTPVDGEDLSRYRLDVARQAKRFKRYPLLARERGWAGRSEVVLSLGPNSALPDVTLEKTSGYPLLDEQAVETILRASRAAKVPPGLQRRSISIVVPVVFDLEE